MNETSGTSDGSPKPEAGGSANAAQEAFGRYRARVAGGPTMMPMMPGPMPGWGMPPSMAMFPQAPGYMPTAAPGGPHPMGSLTERLGATLRLGVDLLNAALASGAGALSGMGAAYSPGYGHGGPWHTGGCGCESGCGYDCCEVLNCGCCRPGVSSCGCGCCC